MAEQVDVGALVGAYRQVLAVARALREFSESTLDAYASGAPLQPELAVRCRLHLKDIDERLGVIDAISRSWVGLGDQPLPRN
jgi:hypothetical protein